MLINNYDNMELKQRLAQKMLDNKLDFLWLDDSLELNQWEWAVITKFSWVYNDEELDWLDWVLEFTENSLLKVKKEMQKIYGEETFIIGKWYDEFEEFTTKVCPSPTYIDLIK